MSSGLIFLIRCDASPLLGLGHAMRCLVLAEQLRKTHGFQVHFAMCEEGGMGGIIDRRGFPVHISGAVLSASAKESWLIRLLGDVGAGGVIIDCRDELSREAVGRIRSEGVFTVALDDPSPRALAADVAYFPPVPQVLERDFSGCAGQLRIGWEWVVLNPEFSNVPEVRREDLHEVLITMGGSDPAGLTIKVVNALRGVAGSLPLRIVLGSGFRHWPALRTALEGYPHEVTLEQDVARMAVLMRRCRFAVSSYGVTGYELAAAGVPSILLSLSDQHRGAQAFAAARMAIWLGMHSEVTDGHIMGAVECLRRDGKTVCEMSSRARQTIDGRGAARIAADISGLSAAKAKERGKS